MILFLHGPNTYLRLKRVQTLRQGFIQKYDAQALNVAAMDAANFSIDEFRKHTRSAGLFSSKRFVLLENVWALPRDDQQLLQEELMSVGEETILCISADAPPRKNNALYKWLATNAHQTEAFAEPTEGQLQTFVQQEAARYGATIDQPAVSQLVAQAHGDQWQLSNDVHKLANYTDHITQESVRQFASEELDDNVFHLTDALGARNAAQATSLFEQQVASGQAPQYLLAMLGQHIALLLKIKRDTDGNLKLHPFVKQKATAQAKHFSTGELFQLYWNLLTIDEQLKSSSADAHTLLTQFVAEACATPTVTIKK